MRQQIETLARYMKTTVPTAAISLDAELRELADRVARWRQETGYAVTLQDRHLVEWKEGRGPLSADLIRHPKAGPAWLALARAAVANV